MANAQSSIHKGPRRAHTSQFARRRVDQAPVRAPCKKQYRQSNRPVRCSLHLPEVRDLSLRALLCSITWYWKVKRCQASNRDERWHLRGRAQERRRFVMRFLRFFSAQWAGPATTLDPTQAPSQGKVGPKSRPHHVLRLCAVSYTHLTLPTSDLV